MRAPRAWRVASPTAGARWVRVARLSSPPRRHAKVGRGWALLAGLVMFAAVSFAALIVFVEVSPVAHFVSYSSEHPSSGNKDVEGRRAEPRERPKSATMATDGLTVAPILSHDDDDDDGRSAAFKVKNVYSEFMAQFKDTSSPARFAPETVGSASRPDEAKRDAINGPAIAGQLPIDLSRPLEDYEANLKNAKNELLLPDVAYSFTEAMSPCPRKFQQTMRKYSQWHHDTLNKMHEAALKLGPNETLPRPVPVVIFFCNKRVVCGGMGDRFKGCTQAFYFALRLKALFFIDLPETNTSIIPATFNWRIEDALPILSKFYSDRDQMDTRGCHGFCKSFGNFTFDYDDASILGNSSIKINSNRGFFYRYNRQLQLHEARLPDVGLNRDSWGCIYRALFRPSATIERAIAPDVKALTEASVAICIQVRSGDNTFMNINGTFAPNVTEREYMAQLQCVSRFLQLLNSTEEQANNMSLNWTGRVRLYEGRLKPSEVMVLLASDNEIIRAEGKNVLGVARGVQVRNVDVKPLQTTAILDGNKYFPLAPNAFESTMREWFTLAHCPLWAGSLKSGFAKTAALYSMTPNVLASRYPLQISPDPRGCHGLFSLGQFILDA